MKAFVFYLPVEPVEPEQRVALDLSVKEFAMIANLAYQHLEGDADVRHSLERGIEDAGEALDRRNGELFRKAYRLSKHEKGWNSDRVEEVFA